MFIGHIPAGYLATKGVLKILSRRHTEHLRPGHVLFWGIIGSVLPDFDVLYFYLIDNRQHLHHGYWTHIPFFWCAIFSLIFLFSFAFQRIPLRVCTLACGMNVFLHLFLDTIVGKIRWLYPLSARDIVFFHVPSVHDWWVWNFVFHWTFLFEIALMLIAVYIMLRRN